MEKDKKHDLYDFMFQISEKMSSEYDRIQKRATEDPGTAGDQGEENWADLFREWIPPYYQVVTKGRIINEAGETSPQVDVLILKSSYPKSLLGTKLYLGGGIAAAFECKTTLKTEHIEKTIKNCSKIKDMYFQRSGSPYRELNSPIIFGLLAHSHAWKSKNSSPEDNIEKALIQYDKEWIEHPRKTLDLLCVADLGIWVMSKLALHPGINKICTTYMEHSKRHRQVSHFTPIGTLISSLYNKLAWEDPSCRDLAQYFRFSHLEGLAQGQVREWPLEIFSKDVLLRIQSGKLNNPLIWDEWSFAFI
jgi:hypothetical protein